MISYSDNITLSCSGESFIDGLRIVSLGWVDPNGVSINITEGDEGSDTAHVFTANYLNLNLSASLDLELRNVILSQAGVYMCIMGYEFGTDNRNIATTNVTQEIFIQGTVYIATCNFVNVIF